MNTPYYLLSERKLRFNLESVRYIKVQTNAKFVLALKCFASVKHGGKVIMEYLDGTTSSSEYEARLGKDYFGGETHAYCVGFKKDEIERVSKFADKVIFNSASQLLRYKDIVSKNNVGVRVNSMYSYSHITDAITGGNRSRLGLTKKELMEVLPMIKGCMFHYNCENGDCYNFKASLDILRNEFDDVLKKLEWVSLGGGISFTNYNYPLFEFANCINEFKSHYNFQLYFEPGEALFADVGKIVTEVVDIVKRDDNIIIVDASAPAHLSDLLPYREDKDNIISIKHNGKFDYVYRIDGRSCLGGDSFGKWGFENEVKVGDIIEIPDIDNIKIAAYSIVKKNWFNGLSMPRICYENSQNVIVCGNSPDYVDYLSSLI